MTKVVDLEIGIDEPYRLFDGFGPRRVAKIGR